MPKSPADLFAFLDEFGIAVSTVSHPPLFTVADSQALRGEIAGGHTKNLFLKDKKDNFFLVTADENAEIDLKQHLGVTPGAVTPFGLLNDASGSVRFVLDEPLLRHDTINAHPLTNEATSSIASADLLRFVRATGREPLVLKVSR